MTLDEVFQHALRCHPRLRVRQQEVEIARAKLITAGLLPNPQWTVDVEGAVESPDPTQMTNRVMFTVPMAGKRRRAQAAATAGIQRARCTLSAETELVLLEAADAALEVLYLQELAVLDNELSDLAARVADVQRSRFELQQITFAARTEAETDAADAGMRRLAAATKLETSRLRLSQAIGLLPPQPVTVSGQLTAEPVPAVPIETVLAAAQRARPELAVARASVMESQQQHALARAKAFPDIAVGPRYNQNLAPDDDGFRHDRAGARIQAAVPLFDRNQGGIAETAAQTRANCALLDVAELTTLSGVASAYQELLRLRGQLEYYEKQVVPLAENTQKAIRDALETRSLEVFQLSDLQQKFARMKNNYLDLRYRYNLLEVRLELFLGRPLSDLGSAEQ